MNYKLIDLPVFEDERGALVPLESMAEVPFEIKRVYFMYNIPTSAERGFHAHKNLQQVVVCLRGACKFILDDGFDKQEITLDRPNFGLYIGNNVWREMKDFSENCIVLVLASDHYFEDDYIRDYNTFRATLNKS